MSNRTLIVVFTIGGMLIGAASSAYSAFLGAPAAIAARPQLAELAFWTAMFSGRFTDWLFYNHPVGASALFISLFGLVAALSAVVMDS